MTTRLTTEATYRLQLLAQRTLSVDIKVIAHEPAVAEKTEPPPFLAVGEHLVTSVAALRELDRLLIIFPESLDSSGTLVLVPHVVPPCALDTGGHIVPVAISHSFEGEQLVIGVNNCIREVRRRSLRFLES